MTRTCGVLLAVFLLTVATAKSGAEVYVNKVTNETIKGRMTSATVAEDGVQKVTFVGDDGETRMLVEAEWEIVPEEGPVTAPATAKPQPTLSLMYRGKPRSAK